jgi:hypothetical protein
MPRRLLNQTPSNAFLSLFHSFSVRLVSRDFCFCAVIFPRKRAILIIIMV